MAVTIELTAPEGEQYNAYTVTAPAQPPYPIGTLLRMQDGRAYRFVKNGGSTLTVGNVLQSSANVGNHNVQAATINAVGARSPVNTIGGTSATANQYAGGYLVFDTTPGGGELYLIDNHLSNAGSAALITNLAAGHAIRTATSASSTFSLLSHPYQGVIQNPATTPTGVAVGIAVKALTSGQYGWVQTRGVAEVLVSGTPVLSNRVIALTAAAGVAGPAPTSTSGGLGPEIGRVLLVGATWMTVWLTLD